MSKAAAAKTDDNVIDLEDAKPVRIDPQNVEIDTLGQKTRTIMVWAPEGATGDDMRDPKIWERVQKSAGKRLVKHDELRIYAADESWRIRAEVCASDNASAQLVIDGVKTYRTQADTHYTSPDGAYVVRFSHGGYYVERVQDKQRMTDQSWEVLAGAIAYIQTLYPGRVG